jgi:hypothetical protein
MTWIQLLRTHNPTRMKKALWGLVIVVAGVGLFGLRWANHGGVNQASATSPSSASTPVTNAAPGNPAANTSPPAPHPALVSPSEFQQLRAAREAALQANPDLAAEYKQIINDMQIQQAKFDAAMIKADPKVAPIVAKLVALRQLNGGHAASPLSGSR